MTKKRVLVLGGGYAGVLASRQIANGGGDAVQVTLITERPEFLERIRLHEVAAGSVVSAKRIEDLVGPSVTVRVQRVTGVDPGGRTVMLDGAGPLPFDALLIATGSTTARKLEGASHALTLNSVGEAEAIREVALGAAVGGQTMNIVGGGLTAIELSTELQERLKTKTRLVFSGALGGAGLSDETRRRIEAKLVWLGVELVHARVARCVEHGIELEGGTRLNGPVVLAAGFQGAALAVESGLRVNDVGQIIVDDHLCVPKGVGVFAAGDAACVVGSNGEPLPMACKTAMPMALCAADNVLRFLRSQPLRPFQFGDTGVCLSLGRSDAAIEMREASGRPIRTFGGTLGVWSKEFVCRSTLAVLGSPTLQLAFRGYVSRAAPAPKQLLETT